MKSNEGPKWVHNNYEEKSRMEDRGGVLQGPDCNKERRDKQVQGGDTRNGIVRSR